MGKRVSGGVNDQLSTYAFFGPAIRQSGCVEGPNALPTGRQRNRDCVRRFTSGVHSLAFFPELTDHRRTFITASVRERTWSLR